MKPGNLFFKVPNPAAKTKDEDSKNFKRSESVGALLFMRTERKL